MTPFFLSFSVFHHSVTCIDLSQIHLYFNSSGLNYHPQTWQLPADMIPWFRPDTANLHRLQPEWTFTTVISLSPLLQFLHNIGLYGLILSTWNFKIQISNFYLFLNALELQINYNISMSLLYSLKSLYKIFLLNELSFLLLSICDL